MTVEVGSRVLHDGLTWTVSDRRAGGWLQLVRESPRSGTVRKVVRSSQVRPPPS